MTRAQRAWIEKIGAAGQVPVADIPRLTYQALLGHGMIQDCERMYFGPRTHRAKLTSLGQAEREKQKAKAHATTTSDSQVR